MSIIGAIFKTIELPISVVKDVVTLGNAAGGSSEEPYTMKNLRDLRKEAEGDGEYDK